MTTTVDDVITECENHLYGGSRDEINQLANSIGTTDTTFSLTYPLGGVGAGAYLAVDLEIIYVWSVDSTSLVVTVQRGMLGSTAAAHTGGTLVYVNPLFSKWQIWNAVNVEITSLSGANNGLFAEKSFTLTTQPVSINYDVPSTNLDIRQILEIRWDQIGPERPWPVIPRRSYQVMRDVLTDTGTTKLSIRIERGLSGGRFIPGRRMVVRYQGDFTALTATLSDDALATSNMSATQIDIPPLGAAARLMGVREAKRNIIDVAVGSRRSAEVPSGGAAKAAGVLLQLLDKRVMDEADRLAQLWPMQ